MEALAAGKPTGQRAQVRVLRFHPRQQPAHPAQRIRAGIKLAAKGGTISCALRQEPGETDGWCITEIAITDTGIGISEEFQSHIFESFSRERSSTVSGIEGTVLERVVFTIDILKESNREYKDTNARAVRWGSMVEFYIR